MRALFSPFSRPFLAAPAKGAGVYCFFFGPRHQGRKNEAKTHFIESNSAEPLSLSQVVPMSPPRHLLGYAQGAVSDLAPPVSGGGRRWSAKLAENVFLEQ